MEEKNTRKFQISGGIFDSYQEIILIDNFSSTKEILEFVIDNLNSYLITINLLYLVEKLEYLQFYTLPFNILSSYTLVEDTIYIYEYYKIIENHENNLLENIDKNINIMIINKNFNEKNLNYLINSILDYTKCDFFITNDNEISDLSTNKINEINDFHKIFLNYLKNDELKKFYN